LRPSTLDWLEAIAALVGMVCAIALVYLLLTIVVVA
jgi:hypothetical protein